MELRSLGVDERVNVNQPDWITVCRSNEQPFCFYFWRENFPRRPPLRRSLELRNQANLVTSYQILINSLFLSHIVYFAIITIVYIYIPWRDNTNVLPIYPITNYQYLIYYSICLTEDFKMKPTVNFLKKISIDNTARSQEYTSVDCCIVSRLVQAQSMDQVPNS